MRIIFYGTPEISLPYLDLLARDQKVVGVVAQPDKPAGRKLLLEPGPVKTRAQELGIRIFQPARSSQIVMELRELAPDLAVAVAYGQMLKPDILSIPKLGTLNVHFSLLPKYRGAAPVQWALARGETKTGVTIFWLDQGMDTGPIFVKKELAIEPDENSPALIERLKGLGLKALEEVLQEIAVGRINRLAQEGEPSLAPLIKKEDARISFGRPAAEIHNLVRGMRLWPRAFLELEQPGGPLRLLVLKTRLPENISLLGEGPDASASSTPGAIIRVEPGAGFLIQCLSSRLWFLTVQPEGKKPVNAADFLNGQRLAAGLFLPVKT
ncbi:MAG: methionyl-tRNA formyltransferase [Elusimicrobia bacterium RIFCSPHIGHO2_02_FULL_57_9]|nr:MAG: methionyl-tRNA formyltransferase [Elusimicrobia bacterium RIFCSPHIGHO2_02_FULL_57_9]